MSRRTTHHLLDGAKRVLSLEGLVGALMGGGVWAIRAALFTLVPKIRLGASLVAGAGIGLPVVAGFVWLVVMPKRAGKQERIHVLKGSARPHLEGLAAEGERKWTGANKRPVRVVWEDAGP